MFDFSPSSSLGVAYCGTCSTFSSSDPTVDMILNSSDGPNNDCNIYADPRNMPREKCDGLCTMVDVTGELSIPGKSVSVLYMWEGMRTLQNATQKTQHQHVYCNCLQHMFAYVAH